MEKRETLPGILCSRSNQPVTKIDGEIDRIEESGVGGGVSGKICSVRASENACDEDRGGGEEERGGITSNASWLTGRAGDGKSDGDNASSAE